MLIFYLFFTSSLSSAPAQRLEADGADAGRPGRSVEAPTGSAQSGIQLDSTRDSSKPAFRVVNFGGHSMFGNPRYMDLEVSSSVAVGARIDINGFFAVVPTTFGYGGSHYGELKATLVLFRPASWFQLGPATERVALSDATDFSKFGIAGKAGIGNANFNWEIFPYAMHENSGGVSTWYTIPLAGRWKVDGFWDLIRGGTTVGKVNLHYSLSPRLDLMTEYFHNGFLRGADQDRIGIGIGYKLR